MVRVGLGPMFCMPFTMSQWFNAFKIVFAQVENEAYKNTYYVESLWG